MISAKNRKSRILSEADNRETFEREGSRFKNTRRNSGRLDRLVEAVYNSPQVCCA